MIVEFKEKVWNNEELMLKWIDRDIASFNEQTEEEMLLVLDVVRFHKTEQIKQKLEEMRVATAMIPPGFTYLLQLCDTAADKALKGILLEEADIYIESREADEDFTGWSPRERRVMCIFIVARGMARLSPSMVSESFVETGITVRPDGSEDHLIKIKGIDKGEINFTGWEVMKKPSWQSV